eukprot:gnl/TRDRNA2_/TRDRNA2_195883_c0_seq1.p1 gnl/TRDRNA2_/TRDRNA2_195883_c0~~gnl/TRDRNA2_/TRDRNA2_195883_c0_seq1.p1  ORF type:complete len:217 (+),score=29.05 gnl/TRDRNA2_/TRDRNA2_195883_c0_seq1:142-792(+)
MTKPDVGKGSGKKGGLAYMIKQSETTSPTPSLTLCGRPLQWFCINDVVMGGQSVASVSATDDGFLLFEGSISTDGGGFCSCRTRDGDKPFGIGYTSSGLKVTYVSDNSRYKVALSAGPLQSRNVEWVCELPPGEGRHTVVLPFADFRSSIHGEPQEGMIFDSEAITSFGVICSVFDMKRSRVPDFHGGQFRFSLQAVEAVSIQASRAAPRFCCACR